MKFLLPPFWILIWDEWLLVNNSFIPSWKRVGGIAAHTHGGLGQWDEQPLPGAEPHCTALVTHQTMFHVHGPCFVLDEAEAQVRRRQKQVVRLLLVFQQLLCRRPRGAALRIEGAPGPICLPLPLSFFNSFSFTHHFGSNSQPNTNCELVGAQSVEPRLSRLARLTLSSPAGSFS